MFQKLPNEQPELFLSRFLWNIEKPLLGLFATYQGNFFPDSLLTAILHFGRSLKMWNGMSLRKRREKDRVMDSNLGGCVDWTEGPGLANCCAAPAGDGVEDDGERLLNPKAGDGELSSASSSSESSMLSTSPALPFPVFSPNPPMNTDEEKEMLSGCSKSFTGLKLFTRR